MNRITTRARRSFLLGGLCLLSLQEIFPSQGHAMYAPPPQEPVAHHAALDADDGVEDIAENAMAPAAEPEQTPWWKRAYSWCQQNQILLYTYLYTAGAVAGCGVVSYLCVNNGDDQWQGMPGAHPNSTARNLCYDLCQKATETMVLPFSSSVTLAHLFPTQWFMEAGKDIFDCCVSRFHQLMRMKEHSQDVRERARLEDKLEELDENCLYARSKIKLMYNDLNGNP